MPVLAVLAASPAVAQSVTYPAHVPGVTENEIQAQQKAHRAWNEQSYRTFVENGGCNGDVLEPRVAEACWHQGNASAAKQMGSEGGE